MRRGGWLVPAGFRSRGGSPERSFRWGHSEVAETTALKALVSRRSPCEALA